MKKNSRFEQIMQHYREGRVLLILVLLLCACTAQVQPITPTSPARETDFIPETGRGTSTAVSTFIDIPASPRPPSQTETPNTNMPGAELVKDLRRGGYIIYIHSAEGEESQSNAGIQDLENCNLPTDLNEQLQTDARLIGTSFLALGIPVARVQHSEACRSQAIAMLAFNRGENWADLEEFSTALRGERIAALRQILSTPPPPGMNDVFIGHGSDIADVTGTTFEAGEAAIYQPLGNPGYSLVARLLPEAWDELVRNADDLVEIEPYTFDAIPLETEETMHEPDPTSQSGSGGQSQIVPPTRALPTESDLILPDLITLPPTDLRIRTNPADGHKLLRFTNSIMNLGPGTMEIWGETNPATGRVTVTQHIYTNELTTEKVVVGEFFFHLEHHHWHFGNFARYEILSIRPDGSLDAVVAFSNKVSYCLRDDELGDIPGTAARQTYISCDDKRQGISAGWVDVYRYYLPGQSIDINSLSDGIYALRSGVDPENSLWDSNRENNTAILYIHIEGNNVAVLESPNGIPELPDSQNE